MHVRPNLLSWMGAPWIVILGMHAPKPLQGFEVVRVQRRAELLQLQRHCYALGRRAEHVATLGQQRLDRLVQRYDISIYRVRR